MLGEVAVRHKLRGIPKIRTEQAQRFGRREELEIRSRHEALGIIQPIEILTCLKRLYTDAPERIRNTRIVENIIEIEL
jgi:hypothetical protein